MHATKLDASSLGSGYVDDLSGQFASVKPDSSAEKGTNGRLAHLCKVILLERYK